MEKNDDQALRVALGENWRRFIPTDGVDREDVDAFLAAWNTSHKMVADADGRVHLAVGADEWILPIPIVKRGNSWRFDVKAGAEEILTRRRPADSTAPGRLRWGLRRPGSADYN